MFRVLRNLLFILAASTILGACYYKPFIGYTLNKKGFKNFSKNEKQAGDNTLPARDYNVNRYDWSVEVFPEKEFISGKMDIQFTTQSELEVCLFDLQKKMKILSYECSEEKIEIKRKKDLLYLKFDEILPANTRVFLSIEYEGKPANIAGNGPIQWKEDKKGRPWISTVTEGIGPHFIMPCNALLKSEPDSVSMEITVPSQLNVVANGQLISEKNNINAKTKTFKYEITNTINTYSISFNIGHFINISKPYTDINGVERNLSFHVLDYNKDTASAFYDQTAMVLRELEKLYGEFPFWKDGCKFIESTFTAMEHQSGIAMGSYYKLNWEDLNTTLIHELAHEWWGNSLTGYDYCDIWIHEGMATYSEALVIEKLYGSNDYDLRMKLATLRTKNKIPILKECGVLYNSWVNPADQDIYNKGALMMHSLRKIVDNDSLFFRSLYHIQQDYSKRNVPTQDLISKFNSLLGKNYSELFNWYLNRLSPPILEVYLDEEKSLMYYRWQEAIPFYKNGEVFLKNKDKIISLTPSTSYLKYSAKDIKDLKFQIERSIYYEVEYRKSISS